jgi:ferrous iron transport protein A
MAGPLVPVPTETFALNVLPRSLVGVQLLIYSVRSALTQPNELLKQRLSDLGFQPQEFITVIRVGPFGGDPIIVRVAQSTYALRLAEAALIYVVRTDD